MNILGTASRRERQRAMIFAAAGQEGLCGRIGALSSQWDMGGPLDAPEVLPAGAMNSTEWRNGRGEAVARQNEIQRA